MFDKKIWKVFDAYMYDKNENLVLRDRSLTSSSISQTAQKSTIQNGADNGKWGVFYSSKEITGELASNVLSMEKLAIQAGANVVSGATTMHTDSIILELDGEKSITLPKEPVNTASVKYIDMATGELVATAPTYASNKATFTGDIAKVEVLPYIYSVELGQEIVIKSEGFPSSYKLVLKTVEVDSKNQITGDVEIVFESIVPSADWTLATNSNFGDGMDNTLAFEVIEDENTKEMGRIKIVSRK